jgi:broad specificity phosphatase PhoE
MRWRAALACAVLALAVAGSAAADDEALWTLLRAGGQVIMLRHAGTDGTPGDPPGARLDDCATQRNLTAKGREQARKIGAALRAHEIPIGRVLSSPWCRCMETAQLAFGRAEPVFPLLGGPRDAASIEKRIRALRPLLGAAPVGGNLVLVTHAFTILDATRESAAEGEMVIFTPQGDDRFTLAGHLMAGGPPR